ncbi:MAG: hypothetical protein ACLQJR_20705 [Stellaceae bacterium]
MVLAVLVSGLSLAGCAPSLEANKERGGVIRSTQLLLGTGISDVPTMADKYCGQFGRSAHISGEQLGWFWQDTLTFDCID